MVKKYKIVADENMPGIGALFSEIADITYANGRDIDKEMLSNADALFCRSITKVNASLLNNSSVQFVGTATIGVDHLNTEWLNAQGIRWSNAAGCNAPAVGQYVLSAISYWCLKNNRSIKALTVGILGAGNVGSILAKYLSFYGINYKLCDPPLKEGGDPRELFDLQSIIKCDVISIHVPITSSGLHSTEYLFSKTILEQLNKNQLLINASRGAVIHNRDLDDYLKTQNSATCILDVYENEPKINPSLVKNCLLATPHIAGHTLEGKVRGSWMVYVAFCKSFGLFINKNEEDLYPVNNQIKLLTSSLEQSLIDIYDISLDSKSLKSLDEKKLEVTFDLLRKDATNLGNGITRRDFSGWEVLNSSAQFSLPY